MTWDLWDDGTRVAVGFGRNIYKVRPDCVLMILGPDFKECPRPEKPCPRKSRDTPEWFDEKHPKCRQCTWSPIHGRWNSMEAAVRMAEEFDRLLRAEAAE